MFQKGWITKVFLLFLALLFSSCRSSDNVIVSFDTAGGTPAIECQIIQRGGMVEPVDPPRRTGFIFGGWYTDTGHTSRWDFDNGTVTADKTLYARWQRSSVTGSGPMPSPGGNATLHGVYDRVSWMAAFDYIFNSAAGSSHIINIVDSFDVYRSFIPPPPILPTPFRFINGGRTVYIRQLGGNHTVRFECPPGCIPGCGVYTVVLNDPGTRLILDGPVFDGIFFQAHGGPELVLKSGTIKNNFRSAVHVGPESTFTMNGGTIDGNNNAGSTGVEVSGQSSMTTPAIFAMHGGTITGNENGGVRVYGTKGSQSGKTVFNMTGGTITGNNGSGVVLTSSTFSGGMTAHGIIIFNMSGGTITNNIAATYGGGVFLRGHAGSSINNNNIATFNMTGGTIGGNLAANGGGVFVRGSSHGGSAVFSMSGGAISNNTSTVNGGGVFVSGGFNGGTGTFQMSGGKIYGDPSNTAANPNSASLRLGATGTLQANFMPSGNPILGSNTLNTGTDSVITHP